MISSLLLLAGCGPFNASPTPSIVFTKIPPYGMGDANRTYPIAGRVAGVRPGQRIVLYAKSGEWWIQPLADKPFTTVHENSAWSNQTHPGTLYAALLVDPLYHPRAKIDLLPEKGGGVLAVKTTKDAKDAERIRDVGKTVQFAGYEWLIRQTPSNPGGTANSYDASNVWTDRDGFLHLRIEGSQQHWTSSEVSLLRSLGYGSYRFVVRNLSELEPAEVFSMMTWADEDRSREMDIEISQWGETSLRNAQFVIQPFQIPANTVQFRAPSGPVTFMLRWAPGRAWFKAFRGVTARWEDPPVREHVFTSGVPDPGNEMVHMNLYVFDNRRNPLRHGSEVIVEAFEYLP